jgi:putative transcriptional regulator
MELAGRLIIAMPGMGDPRFDRAVIYMCAHSDDGAMGLIVNKPLPDLHLGGLLGHLGRPVPAGAPDRPVHFGGPVERGRGFVLHSADREAGPQTMAVSGGLGLTATVDILEALAARRGPARALVALGYAGWGPGQLEREIARNDWLVAEGCDDLIFAPDDTGKWAGALARLGIDPLSLSAVAGRA